ncbi:sporulation protein YunB [Brevibacillus daliensis]|uniref:sporulation protein YunB n=1 Tax=Brevibacillus daliensis TaxID=2892995 RepID=UPI001E4B5622|nr:sporulation protein YunB [Brevibacillus daliensis]
MRTARTRKKWVFVVLVLLFAFGLQGLFYVEDKIKPTLLVLAKQKTESIAKEAIADAVIEHFSQLELGKEEIFQVEKDNGGRIQAIFYNFQTYSKIMSEANLSIKQQLKDMEQKKIDASIPLGLATGSSLLASTGPQLPITIAPVGSAKTWLDTEMKEAGINNVMLTVLLHVEIKLQVIIPFATEQTIITTSVPISNQYFPGEVPQFNYSNNSDGATVVPPIQVAPAPSTTPVP